MPKVPMTTPDYLSKILRRAAHNGGITLKFNPNSKNKLRQVGGDYWYFPAFPDKTKIVTPERLEPAFAEFTATYAQELAWPGRYLGLWRNPKTGNYYLDINIRATTKEQALKRMEQINKVSKRRILAAYNPSRDTTVNTP